MSPPSPPPSLRILQAVQTISSDPESSVASIAVALCADGALVYCIENSSIYRYAIDGAATPDGSRVVAPTTGPGQWQIQPSPGVGKGQIVVPLVAGIALDAQVVVTAALAGAVVGDALALSPAADLPTDVAVAWSRVSAPGTVSVSMACIGGTSVGPFTVTFDVGSIESLP